MAVRGVDEEAYLLDKITKPVGLLLWAATCRAGGRKVTCVVNLGKKKKPVHCIRLGLSAVVLRMIRSIRQSDSS